MTPKWDVPRLNGCIIGLHNVKKVVGQDVSFEQRSLISCFLPLGQTELLNGRSQCNFKRGGTPMNFVFQPITYFV